MQAMPAASQMALGAGGAKASSALSASRAIANLCLERTAKRLFEALLAPQDWADRTPQSSKHLLASLWSQAAVPKSKARPCEELCQQSNKNAFQLSPNVVLRISLTFFSLPLKSGERRCCRNLPPSETHPLTTM